MPPSSIYTKILRHTGVIALAAISWCANSAHAELPFSALLESEAGRYLLYKAPGMSGILEHIAGSQALTGTSREELVNLARVRLDLPEYTGERAALEDRLRQIEERFSQTPAGRASRLADADLSREEMVWLNEALGHVRINPEWHPPLGSSSERVDFLAEVPGDTWSATRERFVREAPDPALADDGTTVAAAERPGARARVKGYLDDMRSCLSNSPPEQRLRINYSYMLSQLMVDEAMTFGGAVIAAGGFDNVEWKNLPQDLAFEAMTSLGDSLIATQPGTRFRVRWFKMAGFGVAQSSADAVLYYINPMKDTHGQTALRSSGGRFAYNTAWNTGYAPIGIALYDLIAGLKCMNVNGAVIMGMQLGAGLGTNVAYFGMRKAAVGSSVHDD